MRTSQGKQIAGPVTRASEPLKHNTFGIMRQMPPGSLLETSLRESITLFESAISLAPLTEMQAGLYHDLGVAHRRFAKYGHSSSISIAAKALLQACLLDVSLVLSGEVLTASIVTAGFWPKFFRTRLSAQMTCTMQSCS